MIIAPAGDLDLIIRDTLAELRKGVALARSANQANPTTGIMADLPEYVDFEIQVITAHQALSRDSVDVVNENSTEAGNNSQLSADSERDSGTSGGNEYEMNSGSSNSRNTGQVIRSGVRNNNSGQNQTTTSNDSDRISRSGTSLQNDNLRSERLEASSQGRTAVDAKEETELQLGSTSSLKVSSGIGQESSAASKVGVRTGSGADSSSSSQSDSQSNSRSGQRSSQRSGVKTQAATSSDTSTEQETRTGTGTRTGTQTGTGTRTRTATGTETGTETGTSTKTGTETGTSTGTTTTTTTSTSTNSGVTVKTNKGVRAKKTRSNNSRTYLAMDENSGTLISSGQLQLAGTIAVNQPSAPTCGGTGSVSINIP